ncbi:MAG TPA: Fe-S cluster assembly protein SufD [Gemmatimonadales bacterium]|nr:Fe-S cluster assembly protein SufD [Gemmatimonadales bacterium]
MTQVLTRSYLDELGAAAEAPGPAWLAPLRRQAADYFAAVGFPTSRHEEWRFTNVAAIARATFQPAAPAPLDEADLVPFGFGHPEWPRLVLVNGHLAPALSRIPALPGLRLGSLGQGDEAVAVRHLARHAPIEGTPFVALNTALLKEAVWVHVAPDTKVEQPIHLVHVTTEAAGTAVHPRTLIVVERGARASVVESYVTLDAGERYFSNAVTEVVLGENAWLEHARIQRESERAFHVGFTHVDQARDSHYRSFTLAMGGAVARHNLHARLGASNVETLLYGLYLTRGEQEVDNHTAIFHDHPDCRSWEVYKGVLEGRSHAVFNGKVFVRPEAQRTDAKQTNRNLLLGDGARVDTKPQLEIFADDVKCTHGATVGHLDQTALFYARSRGVPMAEARRLLTYAFAAEVLEEIAVEPVRLELERQVLDRFERGV